MQSIIFRSHGSEGELIATIVSEKNSHVLDWLIMDDEAISKTITRR